MVTPSYLLVIAEELQRQGVELAKVRLPSRLGFFGAEPWGELMRGED